MLEEGMGRGWPPLPLWHDKWSGEKLQTGFFLGAELDSKTQRETRGSIKEERSNMNILQW